MRTPTPTPSGPTLLTFAVYGPPPVVTAYTKIAADFSAAHPDIVVNVHPYEDQAAAHAAITAARANGDPPDAFLVPRSDLPELVQEKAVHRLDELLGKRDVDFGDGFQRDALEEFSADNALQCMPVDISPMVVYYNTNLVDLAALSRARAARGERRERLEPRRVRRRPPDRPRTAASAGCTSLPTLKQIAPFVWSGGGHLVDDVEQPTTLTLAEGASVGAMEKLLEVVRDPQITFSRTQLVRRSALAAFKAGSLAMLLGYRDAHSAAARAAEPLLRRDADAQDRRQGHRRGEPGPVPEPGHQATSSRPPTSWPTPSPTRPLRCSPRPGTSSRPTSTWRTPMRSCSPAQMPVSAGDVLRHHGAQHPRPARACDTWAAVEHRAATLLTGLFYDAGRSTRSRTG